MNWTDKLQPYGPDGAAFSFAGVYKIINYRAAEYHAYYLRIGADNWGIRVAPRTWDTIEEAKAACEAHSHWYMPGDKTEAMAKGIRALYLLWVRRQTKELVHA